MLDSHDLAQFWRVGLGISLELSGKLGGLKWGNYRQSPLKLVFFFVKLLEFDKSSSNIFNDYSHLKCNFPTNRV